MSAPDQIDVLRSPVIPSDGFVHGFPARTGGVSEGTRGSLNLGYRWGDDTTKVTENRRLLAVHEGYEPDALVVTKHVHGIKVFRVGDEMPDPPEFDGLVSDKTGTVLGAFAADCVPMVFADPVARVCGACHAGWRGTVNGVGSEVVNSMVAMGSKPENIRVALGPSIAACCFEVGPEVVEQFVEALGRVPGLVVDGPKKEHIDLRVAHRHILEKIGVLAEHIDTSPPCTKCNPDEWFSYRRDGKGGGVHMGFIGLR